LFIFNKFSSILFILPHIYPSLRSEDRTYPVFYNLDVL